MTEPDRDEADDPLASLDEIELEHDLDQLTFARMRVELDPHDPMGYLDLGLLLVAYDKIEGADDAFEHVLAIEPGEPNARYWRARIADSWGHTDRALAELIRLAYWFPHADDVIFAPVEAMIDKVVRRMHALFAVFTAFAAFLGLFSGPTTSHAVVAVGALVLMGTGVVAAGLRGTTTWRRLGWRSFRSLIRMIVRRDVVLRVALIVDGVAAAAVIAMAAAPQPAWKALGLIAFVAVLVATALQAFTTRVPPVPESR